ncbi:MAG TPA: dual specificity protein phosphatase family protein [Planctomycetota bacterium]|nr:dual specificity protein phosphatase family protein [Planctomycetota bacterium]
MSIIARLLFYPTLLFNLVLCRIVPGRRWWDWVDESVLLGALPLNSDVAELKRIGITGVINTCCEYRGPVNAYESAGIQELYLPTIDFTPPSSVDIASGVEFIKQQVARGGKVYVHCKAGRGRSATIVMCYLIACGHTPESAQKLLLEKRPHVLRSLRTRKVVLDYYESHKAMSMS